MRELRAKLGTVVRDVAYSGRETLITDNGREIAVIISLDDYERLHEHADVADALHVRALRENDAEPITLADMLDALGVSAEEFLAPAR